MIRCPSCQAKIDASSKVGDSGFADPAPSHTLDRECISICLYCGAILGWYKGDPYKLTEEEYLALSPNTRRTLERALVARAILADKIPKPWERQ